VKALVEEIGFEIQDEKTIDTTYTNNIQSMLGYTYHSAMWAAVKKIGLFVGPLRIFSNSRKRNNDDHSMSTCID